MFSFNPSLDPSSTFGTHIVDVLCDGSLMYMHPPVPSLSLDSVKESTSANSSSRHGKESGTALTCSRAWKLRVVEVDPDLTIIAFQVHLTDL